MESGSTRLERLEIENFRCFAKLDIDFHEKLTVLVAPNGGGKTAILDAACFGWNLFQKGINFETVIKAIKPSDTRRFLSPDGSMVASDYVRLTGTCLVGDKPISWDVSKGVLTPKNTAFKGDIKEEGKVLRREYQNYAERKALSPPTFPLLGYYGTGRLWAAPRITENRRKKVKADNSPPSGYDQSLSSSSRFLMLEVWLEGLIRERQEEIITGRVSPHRPAEKLAAVAGAIDEVLKPVGWHSLHFDYHERVIAAEHPVHGRLPVSSLSDGIRTVISLVGDIAHRCVRLNPHLGADAAKKTSGVVMIDEVDMHLHPEWQQLILEALQNAFPRVQFIVTTHSPQVLSTVNRESIRMLSQDHEGNWRAEMPDEQTRGIESSTAMNDVMGVSQVPPVPEAEWCSVYTQLIEKGRHETEDGLNYRAKLEGHFGKHHPVILDFDRLIHFQAFKLRTAAGSRKAGDA